jgi:subtilisin family serine protease
MAEPDYEHLTFQPGFTGRTLVLLEEGSSGRGPEVLREVAGISATASADLGEESIAIESMDTEGIVFSELSVAVVDAAPDQVKALDNAVLADNPILSVERERIVHAFDEGRSSEYLRGFRDAATALASTGGGPVASGGRPAVAPSAAAPAVDESRVTWGLQEIGALTSSFSGKGVRLAVLDTGFDLQHPDFAGRKPVTRSFVPNEPVQDGNGHGTHCIGTSCGPRVPTQPPRYGIAFGAQIHAGKVLSDRGSGTDTQILGGIDWAITNGCQVISMSLGADVASGTPFSRVFEAVGQRALNSGTLIVSAAGNASRRDQGVVQPVGHPANCPSFLAVAAVDSAGRIASFSSGTDPRGGAVDVSAPGVAIHSSWPMPTRYRTISGTSMACPHVAGVAALLCEARDVRALALWGTLMATARRLPLSTVDAGCGLVQSP